MVAKCFTSSEMLSSSKSLMLQDPIYSITIQIQWCLELQATWTVFSDTKAKRINRNYILFSIEIDDVTTVLSVVRQNKCLLYCDFLGISCSDCFFLI